MGVRLRFRILKNNNKSYYLDIFHNGKRSYKPLLAEKDGDSKDDRKQKKLLAEKTAIQMSLELDAMGTDFAPSFLKNITVLDYCNKYVSDYNKADLPLITASVKKLKAFLDINTLQANMTFRQLTDRHIKDFADYLNYDCGLNGETPHNYWKKFKMIIAQASRDKLLDSSVFENVKFRKKTDYSDTVIKKEVLTEEEIKLLWDTDCGNAEVKKAFLYACYTGLGLAECRVLTWANMQNNKLVTVRTKTGVGVNNMLSEKIIQSLGGRKGDLIEVFDLRNKSTGEYITENGVNNSIKTWMKKAGITKHITFYCGRHTFACRLLLNGANLKTVADAMAHTSTAITQKYLNHINSIKDSATSSLA